MLPFDKAFIPVVASATQGTLQAIGVVVAAWFAVRLAGQRSRDEHRARIELEREEHQRRAELALVDEISIQLHVGFRLTADYGAHVKADAGKPEPLSMSPERVKSGVDLIEWRMSIHGILARFEGYVNDDDLLNAAHGAFDAIVKYNGSVLMVMAKQWPLDTLSEGEKVMTVEIERFDGAVTRYLRSTRRRTLADE